MSLRYKGDGGASSAGLDTLLTLVAHYAPHWVAIELDIPFSALIHLDSHAENFASLKKLVLTCGSAFYGGSREVARAFSRAPKLRDVHIVSGVSATSLARPWHQLVTLRLDNSTPTQCLAALALVPNLVNFTSTLWDSWIAPTPILHLPRLESLRLILCHARGPALLTYLTLPALHHLELDLPDPPHIDNLAQLIVRSTCFLRRLSVKLGPLGTADDVLRLLEAIDSLEELEIRKGGPSIDTAFRLLKAQPRLLPNLKLLHVERTMTGAEDAELIADLLEGRWNLNAPAGVSLPVRLESFRLHSPLTTPPELDSDAVLRLARLQVEGMSIQITSSSSSWLPRRR
ncbi:hypothetical protein B0H17DRAFT_1148267 [Mycena rosella]|uniref:Uncharacterized protein n=1 Tax=Mycena rosella TaxID=1033263 RepID=A0AAD7CDD7_MYCRO|nr:hypothetical protein B0H17DRAFT_1148267 [Mycena rosella]